ncbi:hypothetical protein BDV25DRAFT_163873 [Aspergillus avenaceus]|uniref:Uncharacterized protein n=1 Tax=Aspergillus avenaceus TaxID=36643 RepID=A0A5N6THH9_ASPAV|nr:hypothetical protein BDV25DRAFT_163873 [Aspergillus avenaceus]
MNLSNHLSNTLQCTMSGIIYEQTSTAVSSSYLRKRKRDLSESDIVHISNATKIIPATLHVANSSSRFHQAEQPNNTEEIHVHQQFLPRKRQVLHQPYSHPQSTDAWPSDLSQLNTTPTKLLSSNCCAITIPNALSPPVSPKTFVPGPYLQPGYCTSASRLRPCHICHRKPATKEVLDAYTDCDLCGERSCYICLRQCNAIGCNGLAYPLEERCLCRDILDRLYQTNSRQPHGKHPRKICSCCALEGMTETGIEVAWCLDCVRNHSKKRFPYLQKQKIGNHLLA